MRQVYVHHRIMCAPRKWTEVADRTAAACAPQIGALGGALFGIWRSQIGRPRDELTVLTRWPDEPAAGCAGEIFRTALDGVINIENEVMSATLRPATTAPPERQGNYAFRWFELAAKNWPEFLELCSAAWPGFEAAYDSEVIGLWRFHDARPERVRSLLLTRRPNLGMWERSKQPKGTAEAEVRRKLSRRYDLCDWTVVYTSTLLTATDREDTVRWT